MKWIFWKNPNPAKAGEKEIGMTDTAQAASPAAQSAGITLDQVTQAINAAVAAATKPLLDQMTAQAGELKAVKESAGKAATPEAVAKLVGDQLTAQQNAAQSAQAKATKRTAFVGDKLKGVPSVYADKLGEDEAQWDTQAKTLREQFQADLAAAGVKAPPLTSDAAGTGAKVVSAVVDTSKLSGMQLIGLGVKQNTTAVRIAPAPAAAAGAGGAAK